MNQCLLLMRSWTPWRRCLVRPLIRSSMMLWNTFIMLVWPREPQCKNMFSIWSFISTWQKWMWLSSMKPVKLVLFWNLCHKVFCNLEAMLLWTRLLIHLLPFSMSYMKEWSSHRGSVWMPCKRHSTWNTEKTPKQAYMEEKKKRKLTFVEPP